jgi:hypothetical protein
LDWLFGHQELLGLVSCCKVARYLRDGNGPNPSTHVKQ